MPRRPALRLVPTALALTALALVALTAPAAAQEVKPRILVIFDTSGSMGFDIDTGQPTGGDNSVEYPGEGLSRLFVAKRVIRSIVETTAEVEFALMRYPQFEEEDLNNGIGREGFNGYQGLVEDPLNYEGSCSGTTFQDPDFPLRPYALAVNFESDNENRLLSWIDNQESYPENRELRAEGPTPIAESLRLAGIYFGQELRRDPAARCRRNYVVLLTDGAESCVLDDPQGAVNRAVESLRTTALPGADDVDIKTFVIAFAVGEAVAGALDEAARAGGTAQDGQAFRAADETALRRAFVSILSEAIPGEICNGEDDDCDGNIDEGALNACGMCGDVPAEECNEADDDCDGITDEGVRNACGRCGPVPDEVCNTIDDDCDGLIDEGVANPDGNCAPPSDEVCNGIDDDFDGNIDNRPGTDDPITRGCSTDTGACEVGNEYCVMGRWGGCDGVLPTDELCNGEDDDCDGITDEITRPCGPAANIGDIGQCRVGRQACTFIACLDTPEACEDDGWSAACDDARGPGEEVCDGVDNDCDGSADEGLFNDCGECGMAPPEACNGLDDNCDGRIDEDASCPRGYLCYFGECVLPCANGECASETYCLGVWPDNSFCHPNPCAGRDCGERFTCSPDHNGGCYDACAMVDCAAGEVCDPRTGQCVAEDCHATGCDEGQRCQGGACVNDPCAAVTCRQGEFCREGACFAACRNVQCEPGARCLDGECVPDDCGGRCLRGEICDPSDGACMADPCRGIICPRGQACVDGGCSADAPCVHIRCPAGTSCVDGTCTDHTPAVEPTLGVIVPDAGPDFGPRPDFDLPLDRGVGAEPFTPEPEADFGVPETGDPGGCDCRADSGGPPGWLLGLPLLLWGLRRRRA